MLKFLKLAALAALAVVCSAQTDWLTQVRNKPFNDAREYRFTRTNGKGATGDLSGAGANTVTLTPCPSGMAVGSSVYVSGGVGAAEAAPITGGTCTAGVASGTLEFATANAHTGAWQISSATGGIQEAACALPASGGEVRVPASLTLDAAVADCGKASVEVNKQAGAVITGAFLVLGVDLSGTAEAASTGGSGSWLRLRQKPFIDAREYIYSLTNGTSATGNLAVAGANSVTVTPCPVGVAGANTNHYIYVSGGVGAAEAALITGGTCTSGAATGTLEFTTVNAHTGAWQISSATGGWKEAEQSLPAAGGTILLPETVTLYATMHIGDGSAAAPSTRNAVATTGRGAGPTSSESNYTAGTEVIWAGAAGGTMVQLNGPIFSSRLEDLTLNCGAAPAATAIETRHASRLEVRRVTTTHCSGYAIVETAHPDAITPVGASGTWEDITVGPGIPTNTTASGFKIGPDVFGDAPHLDVARSRYKRVEVLCGGAATSTGLLLQYTDASIFENVVTMYCGKSIHFAPPAGGTGYPINLTFYHAMLGVTPTWEAGWTGPKNILFLDYLQEEDGGGVPQPAFPSLAGIRGFGSYGTWYGGFHAGQYNNNPQADLGVFRDGLNAGIVAHNKTAGNTYLDLLNEGASQVRLLNERASGKVKLQVAGVDDVLEVPAAAGSPLSVLRPFQLPTRAFLNLGTPANGTIVYCSDCTIASPCAAGGAGALAKRIAGAWACN